GEHVTPGQQLFALVSTADIWVTANFKETQLAQMRVGQRASVKLDATGQKLDGEVESFAPATGARFSLLPPENATGNYVKVVQRVPVRIRLRAADASTDRLWPGLSVVPKVWVRGWALA